ncbi:hypothetical protein VNI00_009818 [Paramarasmius palmivorus]|uniref:Uncharacterized protein n=1 Tax=Paramarasmius palmivorus TaxID=297713 RepID=A0AAW0CPX8_9AGAR
MQKSSMLSDSDNPSRQSNGPGKSLTKANLKDHATDNGKNKTAMAEEVRNQPMQPTILTQTILKDGEASPSSASTTEYHTEPEKCHRVQPEEREPCTSQTSWGSCFQTDNSGNVMFITGSNISGGTINFGTVSTGTSNIFVTQTRGENTITNNNYRANPHSGQGAAESSTARVGTD